MRAYEGLFLVDDGRASDNFQVVADHIKGLLERHGATVDKLEKWESHRLAYEVDGKKRGTYILATLLADPAQMTVIERDCRISNVIMRAVFLKEENVGESLEAAEERGRAKRRATTAAKAEAETQPEEQTGAPPEAGPAPEPLAEPEAQAAPETPGDTSEPGTVAPEEETPTAGAPTADAPTADAPTQDAPLTDEKPV